jgi:hypothetical protein
MTESLAAGKQLAHSRATVLRYLITAALLVKLVAIGSAWAQHEILVGLQRGVELTATDASANDGRERLIGIVSLLLFIGSAICWLMWQHRAYANLRFIGSRDTEHTPGWSVGYWFIPFVNLFRPYQITSEIYRRSEIQNGRDPIGGLSGPPLIGAWWFVYLAWGATLRFYTIIVKDAKTLPTLITATNIELTAHVVGLVAAILAIQVIRSIDRFQQAFPITDPIVSR